MKLYKYLSIAVLTLLSAVMLSCEEDGKLLYGNFNGEIDLSGSDRVVIDLSNPNALALTLYWDGNASISLTDNRYKASEKAVTVSVQLSATEDFSTVYEYVPGNGKSHFQLTHSTLNNALMRLGFEGNVEAPLYIRIRSRLANNIEDIYSNAITVTVVPFTVDSSIAFVYDSDKNDTGATLWSRNVDGVYEGFIGAASWFNWYLLDATGIWYGNNGATGTPFEIASSASGIEQWNFWYPGQAGSYYTIVNTRGNGNWWSALWLPSLTVSGDISGEMTFDRKANVWRLAFTAAPGSAHITVSGTGKLYNMETGTDDAAAIDTPVAFSGDTDALSFSSSASEITLDIAASGDATLELNLNDPKQWTLTVTAGTVEEPTAAAEKLFISGLDDGLNGGEWTFDRFLTLYNEDKAAYAAVQEIHSLWGYKFYTEADDWSSEIGWGEGDGLSGTLVTGGRNNIPSPAEGYAGLYVMNVSLSEMTYELIEVNTVSYAGLNDDWTPVEMTRVEGSIYEAEVQKSAVTPWGVKILINDSWDVFFGGGEGTLRYGQEGFDGDNDLENGTYILRVDLTNATYSYTAK